VPVKPGTHTGYQHKPYINCRFEASCLTPSVNPPSAIADETTSLVFKDGKRRLGYRFIFLWLLSRNGNYGVEDQG